MISYPSSTSCGLAWKTTNTVGNCTATGSLEGYDKQVVADVIALLIDALKGIGIANDKLLQAHTKADYHNPSSPDTV